MVHHRALHLTLVGGEQESMRPLLPRRTPRTSHTKIGCTVPAGLATTKPNIAPRMMHSDRAPHNTTLGAHTSNLWKQSQLKVQAARGVQHHSCRVFRSCLYPHYQIASELFSLSRPS